MTEYYPRETPHHRSRHEQRPRRGRQSFRDNDQPYPFSTYSPSNSAGGSSRQYGSSDGPARRRRSSAYSTASSRSDPYFQDPLPRYDEDHRSHKNKSASAKALDSLLPMVVPLLEGVFRKVGVREGDFSDYIEAFKHPHMRSSGSRGFSEPLGDIDIADRLQAVGKLVLRNHGKDIRKLIFTAVLRNVKL